MATVTRGRILRGDQANWDGKTATATRPDATGGTITGLAIGNEVDVLQVYGSGTSRSRGTILNAIQQIGSTTVALVFAPGTWTIDDDVTIASNFTCKIPRGVLFEISSGKTLTFSGPVYADSSTFTSGAGSYVLSANSIVGGNPYYAKTADETTAGITITDYTKFPLDPFRYGLAADGVTNDSTALQAVIDLLELNNEGGTLVLPSGVINLSTTGLSVEKNGIFIQGQGAGGNDDGDDQGTTLIYSGTGRAVTLGLSGGGRWNIGLRRLRVDVSAASAAATGITLFAVRHWVLDNVRVTTSQGAGALTGQIGITLNGESAFCGWGQWLNTFVKGDFTTCLKITGASAASGCNASTFIGGGCYSTTSALVAGSRGLWIEYGRGNSFIGMDFTGFKTQIDCDGDRNFFQVRHETNAGTDYYFDVSGDTNTYISAYHSAATVNNTGDDNVLLLENGFRRLQVQSGQDPEQVHIRTTATNGIAQLVLQNDAITYTVMVNASDIFQVRDSTAGVALLQSKVPTVARQVALLVYDLDNDAMEQVTTGIADSGGAGFKLLRIPN